MISKDLERLIELSSREVTGEEGEEHWDLKNKLEELLKKGVTFDLLTSKWKDIELNQDLWEENKNLKEKLSKIEELVNAENMFSYHHELKEILEGKD